MKLLIQNGRIVDPTHQRDEIGDVAIANGRILAIKNIPSDFAPDRMVDATNCIVAPGLVDLAVRLREPGHEHERMLESELTAACASGITSVVCLPDTNPVLDEAGLIEMLKHRAKKLHKTRVFPLGALTRNLEGEILADMVQLTEAGCVGFTQAELALANTQVLQRAMQYASTFGYAVWLRPQDFYLGKGVAASGALATRMGLSGVHAAAETIALFTFLELQKITNVRLHICRLSSAAGVELIRQAKAQGLPVTCDVSINSLHLTDHDLNYFDSRAHLNPPLRQQRDREALRQGLADGTIDALVSDHTPVKEDEKTLPFAQSEAGATGLELLLSLALKWGNEMKLPLSQTLATITQAPAQILSSAFEHVTYPHHSSMGQLKIGGAADLFVFDPNATWQVEPDTLRSQGKYTPFAFDVSAMVLTGKVRLTLIDGKLAFEAK